MIINAQDDDCLEDEFSIYSQDILEFIQEQDYATRWSHSTLLQSGDLADCEDCLCIWWCPPPSPLPFAELTTQQKGFGENKVLELLLSQQYLPNNQDAIVTLDSLNARFPQVENWSKIQVGIFSMDEVSGIPVTPDIGVSVDRSGASFSVDVLSSLAPGYYNYGLFNDDGLVLDSSSVANVGIILVGSSQPSLDDESLDTIIDATNDASELAILHVIKSQESARELQFDLADLHKELALEYALEATSQVAYGVWLWETSFIPCEDRDIESEIRPELIIDDIPQDERNFELEEIVFNCQVE